MNDRLFLLWFSGFFMGVAFCQALHAIVNIVKAGKDGQQ